MVVESQCKGRKVIGLRVGVQNAHKFIPAQTEYIELQLGHLTILCPLAADFWQGDGEIHDPRLCAWLEAKQLNETPARAAAFPWAMIPDGINSFRLEPARVKVPVRRVPSPSNGMAGKQVA
jgi:hypothetical protein